MNAQDLMDEIRTYLIVHMGADLHAMTADGPTTWADVDLTIDGVQFYLSIESGEA